MLSALTAPRPSAAAARIKEYHPPLGGRDGLRLDFNENTAACSPRVLAALQGVTAAALTRYPERAAVEALVAEQLCVRPEEVLLTNGVDEAIHVLCSAFLDRGDEMLLPVPAYSMYEVYASATEARVRRVQAGADFRFPHAALLAALRPETKLIAIANPNSPTGSVATRAQLLELAERAPHAVVLVDEAYFHFHGESVIDSVAALPNLVVARTFSKAYGLAGLRVGALIARAETMQWLRRVISPYSVNVLALHCLPAALGDAEYLGAYVAEVGAARQEFTDELRGMGVRHWPSAANFVLTAIGPAHAAFVDGMKARGILTRDRSGDPGCEGCVRITVGTREQMRSCAGAMHAVLSEIGWERA